MLLSCPEITCDRSLKSRIHGLYHTQCVFFIMNSFYLTEIGRCINDLRIKTSRRYIYSLYITKLSNQSNLLFEFIKFEPTNRLKVWIKQYSWVVHRCRCIRHQLTQLLLFWKFKATKKMWKMHVPINYESFLETLTSSININQSAFRVYRGALGLPSTITHQSKKGEGQNTKSEIVWKRIVEKKIIMPYWCWDW